MEIKLRPANPEDATLIATAIIEAIGEDIARGMAGENGNIETVHSIFTSLAKMEDSQYSYLNTQIAIDEKGEPMGVCISYDGADLLRLRRAFFAEANAVLGWNLSDEEIENVTPETDPEEFYLDTLMTLPQHRGKGVASALINGASEKARHAGKPLGLLCDIGNARARRLYDSLGFSSVGKRPFAGHDMDHLKLSSSLSASC